MATLMLPDEQYTFVGGRGRVIHITHMSEKVSWVRNVHREPAHECPMLCGMKVAPTWMATAVEESDTFCEECLKRTPVSRV